MKLTQDCCPGHIEHKSEINFFLALKTFDTFTHQINIDYQLISMFEQIILFGNYFFWSGKIFERMSIHHAFGFYVIIYLIYVSNEFFFFVSFIYQCNLYNFFSFFSTCLQYIYKNIFKFCRIRSVYNIN